VTDPDIWVRGAPRAKAVRVNRTVHQNVLPRLYWCRLRWISIYFILAHLLPDSAYQIRADEDGLSRLGALPSG
jgi:hypothetical protein